MRYAIIHIYKLYQINSEIIVPQLDEIIKELTELKGEISEKLKIDGFRSSRRTLKLRKYSLEHWRKSLLKLKS